MYFLIAQILCDSVATTIHKLITIGAVGKQFLCLRDNTQVWILASFSAGIDSRLHKFLETFWNIFHEAINFSSNTMSTYVCFLENAWKISKLLREPLRHFNVTLYITKQFTAYIFVPTVSLLSVNVCKEMILSNVL